MKYLAVVLHFYQPPTQIPEVTHNITKTCYRPLSSLIRKHPEARFTINFNYSLTEQLIRHGYRDVIVSLSEAAKAGHVEFMESSAYHYILPLSASEVVLSQLKLNGQGNRHYFGRNYKPKGVFPPEMAYSLELPKLIQEAGYEWTITDDIAWSVFDGPPPYEHVVTVDGLPVLLRSRLWSNHIGFSSSIENSQHLSGKEYLDQIRHGLSKWFGHKDGYVIVALDAETFGHHVSGYIERFLEDLLTSLKCYDDIKLCTVSDILARFPRREERNLPSCSWSTSAEQIVQGNPFPLWKNPGNPIHRAQGAFFEHILALTDKYLRQGTDEIIYAVEKKLSQAQYSCQRWWANPGIFYDPKQVLRGANLFLEIMLMQKELLRNEDICKAFSLYHALKVELHLPQDGNEKLAA